MDLHPKCSIDALLAQLSGVRKSGSGWTARCPAHDDRNPSLSLRITDSGRLLLHCFAGCSFDEIRPLLGLAGVKEAPRRERLSPPSGSAPAPTPDPLTAQRKALRIWTASRSADPDHPYLLKKRIHPHHARQIQDSLLIPLQDARGDLWNLQFIHPDGQKRFLKGGRTRGLFTVLESKQETGRIYIGEGFATMATVHELTGRDSVVAFSAENLPAVASTIRKHFPKAEIVLAADADEAGERCSEQAARAISGSIAYSRRP